MAATPVTNFGKVTVSIGYNAAATSIVLTTGHGSRLPSTFPYPITWWNATDFSDPADDPSREIVIVTARAGDTLTVTRAAEGTSASNKNTASKTYKMVLSITKAMWDSLFTNSLSQSFRGLTVQTHPDADKALSTVRFSADAIVMDDGQEIRDWSNIDVALTASGVNGIDTGSEAASTIYELWAIFNGATKAGLLHKAKDYFLDETWDQSGATTEDGQHLLRDAAARTKLAQGFQVNTAGLMEFVDIKVAGVGTPTGNFWLTVEATSGGVPSNTPLATSDKYDVSRLTTAPNAIFIRMPFRTPAALSAATQYHLVLQGDFTVSAANHMVWRADTTASTYALGSKGAYDGTTWTNDADDDFLFKIYITRNDVAVTMPSGYTQKAKIGYAVNNSGSNLRHFRQLNRSVFCGYDNEWQVGSLTNTIVALVDLFAFLPPVPVTIQFAHYNGTAVQVAVGGLSCTDLIPITTAERIGASLTSLVAGHVGTFPLLVLSQYQGCMFVVFGGTDDLFILSYEW